HVMFKCFLPWSVHLTLAIVANAHALQLEISSIPYPLARFPLRSYKEGKADREHLQRRRHPATLSMTFRICCFVYIPYFQINRSKASSKSPLTNLVQRSSHTAAGNSVTQRHAILARVRSAHQSAARRINHYGLATTHHSAYRDAVRRRRSHVASADQILDDRVSQSVLHHDAVAAPIAESGRINGLLQAHAHIQKVCEHLYLPLWLNVAAHHPKGHPELAIFEDHRWDYGVEWSLARLYAAGVPRIQAEAGASVVQNNAGVTGDNA